MKGEKILASFVIKNIDTRIADFCKSKDYLPNEVDFKLAGYQTYIKTVHFENFIKITTDLKNKYVKNGTFQRTICIADEVEFMQLYKINIFQKTKSLIDLVYEIEVDDYFIAPVLVIKPESIFYFASLTPSQALSLLYKEVYKIQAQRNILLGFNNEILIDKLKELIKRIYKKRFESKFSIPLFKGLEPFFSKDARMVKFFESNDPQSTMEVSEGQKLLTFYKPQSGKNGISASGEIVTPLGKTKTGRLNISADKDTIKILEDDEKMEFFALRDGLLSNNANKLTIVNKVVLQSVSRVQKQITKDERNNVEFIVNETDHTRDGVGEGTHVKSETIHVTGHIGKRTKVEAKVLKVDGSTHSDCEIFARKAEINTHKGFISAHEVNIKNLEGGEVHATKAIVENVIRGKIFARTIKIKRIMNTSTIVAMDAIEVDHVEGEDNSFLIDYTQVLVAKKTLEFKTKDIRVLKTKIAGAPSEATKSILQQNIVNLQNDMRKIKNSFLKAKIDLNHVKERNKIGFYMPNRKKLIESYIDEKSKKGPYYIEMVSNIIFLRPLNISVDPNK